MEKNERGIGTPGGRASLSVVLMSMTALAVMTVAWGGSTPSAVRMKVGSYNIRLQPGDKGTDNAWDERKADMVELIRRLDLDAFGLQEVCPGQADYLTNCLPQYVMVGVHREDGRRKGEASPVFYRKDRFEALKCGTFWLSETPDVPGSKSWGTACTRVCSWMWLKDRSTGQTFCFANTHTDHVSALARREGMLLIIRRMREFAPPGTPVIFTGDHNCRETEEPAQAVSKLLRNALYISETPPTGPWRTFTGWRWRDSEFSTADALKLPMNVRNARKGSPDADKAKNGGHVWEDCGARIDYIYVSDGIKVKTYETRGDPRPGKKLYPSDHFPVVAVVELPCPAKDAPGALPPRPEPPAKSQWGFVRELATPPVHIVRERFRLVDDYGCGATLKTALDDVGDFLGGGRTLRLLRGKVQGRESYKVGVSPEEVSLTAEDDEGMRRALYHFADRVQAGDLAATVRRPWLRHRFSRCFFAPTKRSPLYTDELMDDVDYYPDAYLSRLAREGVNALWITVAFRDLAETPFVARSPDAGRRLAKLARTAEKLRRYGIGLWLFGIEPHRVSADDPMLKAHPRLFRRIPATGEWLMCPSEPDTLRYLETCTRDIFTRVPALAGFMGITHGERFTTCLSSLSSTGPEKYIRWWRNSPCPKCGATEPWRLHKAVCEALVKGMRAGNPAAEMFSWHYQPEPQPQRAGWVKENACHLPEGVTFVYNFESGAFMKQAGRMREGGDYWLSYVGPSMSFREVAEAVRAGGGRLAAKLQTGCGYEMATVPFVPVPGLVYRKYRSMRQMGVGSVVQCWLVGNYPGVQNSAAGELAFEDFSDGEDAFLRRLAAPEWGELAPRVAEMWKAFSDAYSRYPLSNDMQYYGPFNEGVAWPLYVDVEMKPINPSWKPDFPPCGDTIGEALENHTLEEALFLMEQMCRLPDPRQLPATTDDQRRDRNLMRAVQLHFNSGRNIYEFYWHRREAIAKSRIERDFKAALRSVDRMAALLAAETEIAREMRSLSADDSRLGFHSESENHKYFPALFDWRMECLDNAAARLREIRAELAAGRPYPESWLERNAPRCRMNGPEVSGGGMSFKVSGGDGSLAVAVVFLLYLFFLLFNFFFYFVLLYFWLFFFLL